MTTSKLLPTVGTVAELRAALADLPDGANVSMVEDPQDGRPGMCVARLVDHEAQRIPTVGETSRCARQIVHELRSDR